MIRKGFLPVLTNSSEAESDILEQGTWERRYQALVEAGAQVVWIWKREDPDTISLLGKWWETTTGQSIDEVAAFGWLNVVHPDDRDLARKTWKDALSAGKDFETEYRLRARDGNYLYAEVRGVALCGPDGSVHEFIGSLNDVTARKEAEATLYRYTTALERSNKELDDFVYVASHDLKAPLRVIHNVSKWLEEDLQEHLTEETRENMNLLRGRVKRMEKLLDDLLEYYRIGHATNERAELISGDKLIDNILELLSPSEGFTVNVSPGFADVTVRRMPLQQILMNLIGNAVKHHDKKNGLIEVTIEDEGDDYAFAVKDDGPGIPKQFHDQVFKMFQTLKPRDQVEGSGMGLAMVRKNVEIFGGTLHLESSEGAGSTFRFTWPKQQ